MTPERWQQVNQLFHRALRQKPSARQAFLDQACAGDPSLREEINGLLAAHEESSDLIDYPAHEFAVQLMAEAPDTLTSGEQLNVYRILSQIGVGGMGEVYLADDTRLERKVALKVLPTIFTHDALRLTQFHREAKAAAALNHPNIATIYSIEEAGPHHFITMEYIDGKPLSDPIYQQECDLGLFYHWFVPLADALAHAHEHGVSHRDIKPSNIRMTPAGVPKLLDFGLARFHPADKTDASPQAEPSGEPAEIMGTPAYMSPEQAQGKAVGSATDIFSLGVICYEFLAGRHPFDADTQAKLKQAVISQTPLAPSYHNAEIPSPLATLVMQMLEKEPSRRPRATDVKRKLVQLAERQRQMELRQAAQQTTSQPLVGREPELALLHQGFATAASGRVQVLCVAGELGIGKSALVEKFLTDLRAEGELCHIARGQGAERLAGTMAYRPFLSALERLLQEETSASLSRLLQTLAPAWMAQLAASTTSQPPDAAPPAPERFKQELTAWLQEVSLLRPVVFFLDDLHWADASTIDLLSHLAQHAEGLRLLIVVAYRPSDLVLANHPFLPLLPELQTRGAGREIPLAFLSAQNVAEYLALAFPVHPFPAHLPQIIYAKTEGNPLFMVDLARYLRDQHILVEEEGQWILTRPLAEIERELPESVRAMIERKIGRLSEAERQLLAAASVQGYEFDSTIVAEALALDPVEIEEQLATLERIHQFIQTSAETEFPDQTLTVRYRFVHVLYQNVLYATLRPTRRAKLSAAVARALQQHYGERAGEIAATLAHLWEAGREFQQAVQDFLRAAQKTLQLGALNETTTLARRGLMVLARLPEGSERDRLELELQLTLGVAVANDFDWVLPEVQRIFNRARELCYRTGEETRLFNVIVGLWAHHAFRAEYEKALPFADELLILAQKIQQPPVIVTAYYILGFTCYFQGKLVPAKEHFEQVVRHYRPEDHAFYMAMGNLDLGMFAPYYLAAILFKLGYPDQALQLAQETLARAEQTPHLDVMGDAYFGASDIYIYRREWQAHLEMREKFLAFVREHGLKKEYLLQVAVEMHAARGYLGQPEEAVRLMRQSLEDSDTRQFGSKISSLRCLLAEMAGRAGQPAEGLRVTEENLAFIQRTTQRFWEAEVYRVKGELLLQGSAGQPPDVSAAEACFLKAIEVAQSQQARAWELRATISLARLWQQMGRKEEARQRLAAIYDEFTEGFATADLHEAKILLEQ